MEQAAAESSPIWQTIAIDQQNVAGLRSLLQNEGLMALLEQVSSLFERLPQDIQELLRATHANPYVRQTSTGPERAWDFVLRVMMAQSAHEQFLHATGHLLRGHSFQIFGHVRTMIENAGIARLSVTEPDLGDAYLDIARHQEFRNRTARSRILPAADPLTEDLNEAFVIASRTFHSNFVAVAGRVRSDFAESDNGRTSFTNAMRFHDVDSGDSTWFLRHACWLIRVGGWILRLLGASFSLEGQWPARLARFDGEVRIALERLHPILYPGGTPATGEDPDAPAAG